MTHSERLVTLLIVAAGTYAFRVLPLLGVAKVAGGRPGWLDRLLQQVAPAVMGALLATSLLFPAGRPVWDLSHGPALLGSALAAGLVAARTHHLGATVLAGVVVMWLLLGVV